MKVVFDSFDQMNPLWKKFEDHFKNRLDALRIENDRDLDPVKTAEIRGRIAEHRALLLLGKEPTDY